MKKKLEIGFSGLSIGSPFIACEEADISEEYKKACVNYGRNDIVFTTKISGTPCTVINTPYVQKTGTKQNRVLGEPLKFYPIPSELNRIELGAKQLHMNAKIVAAKKVKAGWKDVRCANWFRFNDQAPQIWQKLSDEHNS